MASSGKNFVQERSGVPQKRGLVDDISRDFLTSLPLRITRLDYTDPELRIRTDWFSDDRILPKVAIGG